MLKFVNYSKQKHQIKLNKQIQVNIVEIYFLERLKI